LKTLKNLFRQDKERYTVPKSVQDVIPIKTIWEDGIFLVGATKYAKTYRFEDINYSVASKEDKEAMFLEYSELLNSFDSGATYKISIIVKRLDKEQFKKDIMIPLKGDALDKYRKEYNQILLNEATGANGFIQIKYITVSVNKKNIEEARNFFSRIGTDMTAHLNRLGSRAVVLDAGDKLRLLHDFLRPGEESDYNWNISDAAHKGHSFKDYICPDTFEFSKDHFVMGEKFGRVVFLRDYANYIKDNLVSKLCGFNRNMILAKLLKISEEQLSYVDNADAGCGLMRIGNAIVPYENKLSTSTALYALMTTRPSDISDGLVFHLNNNKN